MCKDLYGFRTKQLWVLKLQMEDTSKILPLYSAFDLKEREKIKQNWERLIQARGDDMEKNVTFVIKDKCKKIIGMVIMKSEDCNDVKFSIWIPNEIKRGRYFENVEESIIEWCEDYTDYTFIKCIDMIKKVDHYTIDSVTVNSNIPCIDIAIAE